MDERIEFKEYMISEYSFSHSYAENLSFYIRKLKKITSKNGIDIALANRFMEEYTPVKIATLKSWCEFKGIDPEPIEDAIKRKKRRERGYSYKVKKRQNKKPRVYPTLNELKRLLKYIAEMEDNRLKERDIIFIQLSFETALRVSEVLQFKLSDLKEGNDGIYYYEGRGKGGKSFEEFFSPKLVEKIKIYYVENGMDDNDYLFSSSRKEGKEIGFDGMRMKEPLGRKNMWARINKLSNEALGKHLHPHSFKTGILKYYEVVKGWDIRDIQRKGKHSDIRTTIRYLGTDDPKFEGRKKKATIEISDSIG